MGVKQAIESLFNSPKQTVIINEGTAVLGQAKQISGSSPNESFQEQVDLFNNDPCVKERILEFAEQCVSTGIFTTMNDDYTLSLPAVGSSKEAIDNWNKKNNLDEKMLQIFTELYAFGNSFWYIGDNGFQAIPIEAILKAVPLSKNTPIQEEYNLMLTGIYSYKQIKKGDFIHFKINSSGHEPFGSGIVLGLIATPDADTPSLYDIRKSVRTSMKIGFEKFSFGNELWTFEGLPDSKIEEVGTAIAGMSSTGNRIATNSKGNIVLSVPQRTQTYDQWIEQIDKEFYLSVGGNKNPNTEYTTKATAEAMAEAYKYKVSAYRRIVKRLIETVWNEILTQLGFNSEKANIRLNFGSEETSITMDQLKQFVDAGVITKDEARKHLIKIAKVELTGDLPKEEPKAVTEAEEKLSKMEESVSALTKKLEDKNIAMKEKKLAMIEKLMGVREC